MAANPIGASMGAVIFAPGSARVLADALPGGLMRDVTLVAGSAAALGVLGNVAIALPFTPVPLSLATLAVLLTGAALGPLRAGLGTTLYLLAGVAGLPLFAERTSGWAFASFGYVAGYVVAAVLVGHLARRGADRRASTTAMSMALGNLCIYLCGLPWLAVFLDVGFGEALRLGALPFLIGDALKLLLATFLLPTTWRVLRYGAE